MTCGLNSPKLDAEEKLSSREKCSLQLEETSKVLYNKHSIKSHFLYEVFIVLRFYIQRSLEQLKSISEFKKVPCLSKLANLEKNLIV